MENLVIAYQGYGKTDFVTMEVYLKYYAPIGWKLISLEEWKALYNL